MITIRRQLEFETVFLLAISAFISVYFVTYKGNYQYRATAALSVPVAPIITETPVSRVAVSSQISPDGTKNVRMKVTQNPDGTSTYDFSTANGSDLKELHISTQILSSTESAAIPFNTWSPDDKYFFIQKNIGNTKSILVFDEDGTPFAGGEAYLDVVDLFNKQSTGNIFNEATGWASESLIIVNSTKQDGTKGYSYWFEVPSKAFIQLFTEF